MISAAGVYKSFGTGESRVDALKNVDLNLSKSRLHALMGESGSGKSTLVNLLAGLDVPDRGSVSVSEHLVSESDESSRARFRLANVAVIFQDGNLIAEMTNLENVALPLWARGDSRQTGVTSALRALDRLGLGHLAERTPSRISGGQRQRVGVARALAGGQRILLADEPTGSLDSVNSEELFRLFASLAHDEGMTIVVATHDPIAANYCDSVTVLQDGQVLS